MMEVARQTEEDVRPVRNAIPVPANDTRQAPLSMGRSVFPQSAVARIFRKPVSVMTSARARAGWTLAFDRQITPRIDPLMGYLGSTDTLSQIELSFPTLESAIRYVERQGLAYVVQKPPRQRGERPPVPDERRRHVFFPRRDERRVDRAANRNDEPGFDQREASVAVLAGLV